MTTPNIITTDTLGTPKHDSPLKGRISRFYNGEGVSRGCRTKDFSNLENILLLLQVEQKDVIYLKEN